MNLKQKAIDLIEVMQRREEEYGVLNKQINQLQGDFSTEVHAIDSQIHSALIKLVDEVLGDYEVASYYLYECLSMSGGGSVTELDGTFWPLRNIEDLTKYVFRDSDA